MNDPTADVLVEVTAIADVARDVRSFRLEAVAGALLPFSAGAHVIVTLDDGERIRRNAYSLVGDPRDSRAHTIAVRLEREGRGGSRFFHERVRLGTRLAVSPPRNAFPLVAGARRHLFVAGGIGITPFPAMAREAIRAGVDFELHHAVRTQGDAAFHDELAALCGDRLRLHRSDRGERLDLPTLVAGRPLGTHLYVCGPNRLIEATFAAARAAHWPESALHCEVFDPPAVGRPFTVDLARSRRTIEVPGDATLLEALEAAGIAIDSMCRGGACGACETAVVACDGEIHHADHWLSPEERTRADRIVPCVSRFEGRSLVLDL